jgi:hypothetical protein
VRKGLAYVIFSLPLQIPHSLICANIRINQSLDSFHYTNGDIVPCIRVQFMQWMHRFVLNPDSTRAMRGNPSDQKLGCLAAAIITQFR